MLDRVFEWVLYATVFLVPLAFSEYFNLGFEFPKLLVFRTGVILLTVLTLVKVFFEGKYRPERAFWRHPVFLCAIGLIAVLGLSTLLSTAPMASFWGEYERQQGYVMFLYYAMFFLTVLSHLKNKGQVARLFAVVTLSGLIVAGYGVLQKFGVDPFFNDWVTVSFLGRIFSTAGQPNFLAQFLVVILPVSCGAAIFLKRSTFFLVSSLVMLAALLFTLSRSAWLGLLAAILCAQIALSYYYKRPLLRLIGAGIVVVFFVVALAANALSGTDFVPENGFLARFTFVGENMRSIQSRAVIWPVALRVIADHPLLGNGPDTFSIDYPRYLNPAIFGFENLHSTVDRAHNEILDMALAGGAVGLALYLLVFVGLAVSVLRYVSGKPRPREGDLLLVLGPFLGIVALFAANQFGFSVTMTWMLFWLYLAVLVFLLSGKNRRAFSVGKRLWVAASAVLLGIIVAVYTVITPARAEMAFRQGRLQHREGQASIAATYYRRALAFMPSVYHYSYWFADAAVSSRSPELLSQAFDFLSVAPKNFEALIYRARILDSQNAPTAFDAFSRAIEFSPHNPRAYYFAGNALFNRSYYENAVRIYEDYLALVPPYWKWKADLTYRPIYERERYRIFYKLNPGFDTVFTRLKEAYRQLGNTEKVRFYDYYLQ